MKETQVSHLTGRPGARILDPEGARKLVAEGWAAADLHVHTLHSYDVIPTRLVDPLMLYQKARRLGMTYIAFTDHDSMDAYGQIGWTREGLVPAVEVKILDPDKVGHTVYINVYALDRGQFGEILKIARLAQNIERLVSYLEDEQLPYTFNHPFWHEPREKPNLRAILDIADLFPVLEYNMGRIARINRQALRLAQARPDTPGLRQKDTRNNFGGRFPLRNSRLSLFSIPAKSSGPDQRAPGEYGDRQLIPTYSCPI